MVVTYRAIPAIGPFVTFRCGTIHVGDDVRNVATNIVNCYMRVYGKFCLETYGQESECKLGLDTH